MTSGPLVSIVMPTYNRPQYLDQAVQSCLSQTYSNWELVIVDDASTDDTHDRIAGYVAADSRIQSVLHEINRKLPAALNTGFSRARGTYLTWTSDDNCYRPQAIAEMVGFLESRPDIDAIYTDYSEIDAHGRILKRVSVAESDVLLRGNCVDGGCFLYRSAVHESIGRYAEDLFLAEDYDFWLRVSARFRLQAWHKDLYLYRIHSGSLTFTQRNQAKLAGQQALARSLPEIKWASTAEKSNAYLYLAGRARSRQNMKAALKYSLLSMRYSPSRSVAKFLLRLPIEGLLGRTHTYALSLMCKKLMRRLLPMPRVARGASCKWR